LAPFCRIPPKTVFNLHYSWLVSGGSGRGVFNAHGIEYDLFNKTSTAAPKSLAAAYDSHKHLLATNAVVTKK
jgi:hypothetical protein